MENGLAVISFGFSLPDFTIENTVNQNHKNPKRENLLFELELFC